MVSGIEKERYMLLKLQFLMVLVIYSILSSSLIASEEPDADIEVITSLRESSNKAMLRHNVDDFTAIFDEDYIINYGSGIKTLSLKAEIISLTKLFTENPNLKYTRTPQSIYISKSAPLAIEYGTWVGGSNSETTFSGRYTAAWRKSDGDWKIHNELFVTLSCKGVNC